MGSFANCDVRTCNHRSAGFHFTERAAGAASGDQTVVGAIDTVRILLVVGLALRKALETSAAQGT